MKVKFWPHYVVRAETKPGQGPVEFVSDAEGWCDLPQAVAESYAAGGWPVQVEPAPDVKPDALAVAEAPVVAEPVAEPKAEKTPKPRKSKADKTAEAGA